MNGAEKNIKPHQVFFNKNKMTQACSHVFSILKNYYHFEHIPEISQFLMEPIPENLGDGRVLFEEYENDFFIGLQFGEKIYTQLETNEIISSHLAAVIAEECSHFKLIFDTVNFDSKTTRVNLEILGEIDRFLCLMHWNFFMSPQKIPCQWKNLHEICDSVFTGHRFKNIDTHIYIEAEQKAFKYLKEAFADDWDNSNYNFFNINQKSSSYLKKLRSSFFLT